MVTLYCGLLLCLISMAEARGWPYPDMTPAAIRARLVLTCALSVAISAATDWRLQKRAASRAAAKAAAASGGGDTAGSSGSHVHPDMRAREGALGLLRAAGQDSGSPPCSSAAEEPESASERTLQASGGGALAPTVTPGGDPAGDATPSVATALHALPPEAAAAVTPPAAVAGAAPVASLAAVAAASPRAALGALPVAGPAWRPRYRSVSRVSRVHVKLGGVSPEQLHPAAVGSLSQDLAARGYLVTSIAVRSGCIEVLLELEDAPGGGGGANASSSGTGGCGGGGSAGTRADLVRRIVATLVGALLPRSARRVLATLAPPLAALGSAVCADAEEARHGGASAAAGDGGGHGAANAVTGLILPVRVLVDGECYLVSRDAGDPPADADAAGSGGTEGNWHVSLDNAQATGRCRLTACSGDAPGSTTANEPVLAVQLPCLVLPRATPAHAAATAAALHAATGTGVLELVLHVSGPPLSGAPETHGSVLEAVASTGAGEARVQERVEQNIPEVLAWMRGCFLQVLSVEEAPSAATRAGCSAFKVTLDACEASYGLLSISVRARETVSPSAAHGGAAVDGSSFGPVAAPARVLLLPPGLAAVAAELGPALAEEALAAVACRDAGGAASVGDFLRDLSEWLAAETFHLDVDAGAGVTGADLTAEAVAASSRPPVARTRDSGDGGGGGSISSSSHACTGSVLSSWAGGGGDRSSVTGPTLGRALTPPATPWAWGSHAPSGRSDASSDGRGGSGDSVPGLHCRILSSVSTRVLPQLRAELQPASAAAAPQGTLWSPLSQLPRTQRLLPAGRLDLRDEAVAAAWAARNCSDAAAVQRRQMEERRWGLLRHAVWGGWAVTTRLLLGLDLNGLGDRNADHAESSSGRADVTGVGGDVAEEPSVLHLAVLSGVPAVVDAVLAAAAAAERYGPYGAGPRGGCGAYGSWHTLAHLLADDGSPASPAAAPVTPLQLAAALAAEAADADGRGRALLAHIQRRYPWAAHVVL